VQKAAQPARGQAGDGWPMACRLPRRPAVAPLLLFRVFTTASFYYLMFLLWTSLGGFLESFGVRFRLGLALKTPLGINKVVRLGLFWVVFWIQALGFHPLQSICAKFLFPFSSYFVFVLVFPPLVLLI